MPAPLTHRLELFGVQACVVCPDRFTDELVRGAFGALLVERSGRDVALEYRLVRAQPRRKRYQLTSNKGAHIDADGAYEVLYALEKTLTIDVQRLRQDLLFVHSASLERNGKAILLIAPSGSGKSTTAWAMLHAGFGYLSDELAPIALATLLVHPYPHALCLKQAPPAPFEVPASAIRTEHTIHVPASALPTVVDHPVPLRAIFFNRYSPDATTPAIREIGSGEASASMYANALNPLAHERHGLAAVASVTSRVACYEVITCRDLTATCALIRGAVDEPQANAPGG